MPLDFSDQAMKRLYPSLYGPEPAPPFAGIQWKGTDVCMDVHCKCGHDSHFDTDFCSHLKCPKCGQVYECSGVIKLTPLDFEPEFTKTETAVEF